MRWLKSNLGVLYADGDGVPKDPGQAAQWYLKAAEQGNAVAQNNLGVLYADGDGVPRDAVRAYAWYNLASAQGSAQAAQNRAMLQRSMTAFQIAEAQALSRKLVN